MPWDLIGDVPVTFEGIQLGTPLIGDSLIKVEHTFDFADFPGVGYAVISDLYSDGVVGQFIRSYPYRNSRIYPLELLEVQKNAGWIVRFLVVKRSRFARVDANVNWRIKIYEWFGEGDPEITIDSETGEFTNDGETIFEGNP